MKENWEKVGEISGPDSKNRVILTPAIKEGFKVIDGFMVFKNQIGEIKLVPQVKVNAHEAWLYKNPKALKQVKEGMEDALVGKAAPLGRFRKNKKK